MATKTADSVIQFAKIKNIVMRNLGKVEIPDPRNPDKCIEKWVEIDKHNLSQPIKFPQENRIGQLQLNFANDGANTVYAFDTEGAHQKGFEIDIGWIMVDNTRGNQSVVIQIGRALQWKRICPAGQFRSFPVPALDDQFVTFTSAGNRNVLAYVSNVPWETDLDVTDSMGDVFVATLSTAAAGSTAIFTPGPNQRMRILKYSLAITNDAKAAVAGDAVAKILDGATDIGLDETFALPAAVFAQPGVNSSGMHDLANGIFQLVDATAINLNLSGTALTGGFVTARIIGHLF